MNIVRKVRNDDEEVALLQAALEHEWAVSFEYLVHAYSMPKGMFFYDDPIMSVRNDSRAQTIQIGIDEMYHAVQLGLVLAQMGVGPSFRTDEVIRCPRILDNFKRDKMTEDAVTDFYQSAEVEPGRYPKLKNMIMNISYDEVRHSRQFQAMIGALEASGQTEAECFKANPERDGRKDLRLIHEICRLENELNHRYLRYMMMFSEYQDLGQRLFKNSINHMRHWDKLSGILVKLDDRVAIENAVTGEDGVEKSLAPMPVEYPGRDRLSALATLVPAEKALAAKYEQAVAMFPAGEIRDQLRLHLALTREHVFTQTNLLENAKKIQGLT